jgi:hypothetical protein
MTSHVFTWLPGDEPPSCQTARGVGRCDVTILLNNAMTVARRPLTQLGYIREAVSRFSSVPGLTVKKSVCKEQSSKSVFKKQLYERVLRCSPTSEVSKGDRHGKCEDAKCVII